MSGGLTFRERRLFLELIKSSPDSASAFLSVPDMDTTIGCDLACAFSMPGEEEGLELKPPESLVLPTAERGLGVSVTGERVVRFMLCNGVVEFDEVMIERRGGRF
jgi:hypothetical protein